jgi:DNA invertase Pin-like site-specific DNA recombinase
MSSKITSDHLGRGAAVYVRQSTMGQVAENTESQRRQYALVESARVAGFASISVIDDDLGRSGSGLMERPGFQKLVASVCAGSIGAVYCIEASRLARNGRDWHHLIDLCALVGALVIDADGVYDPRLVNDRLLLGLKGTMSEYELSLLRQRALAARDSKASRGELRFTLPPGYCWDEAGRIVMDADEHVVDAIRGVFRKFRELGSVRQVWLWVRQSELKLPIVQRGLGTCRIMWQAPAYHTVLQILQNPIYAGAYVFGRTGHRTQISDGRARKSYGHRKPMTMWSVLLREDHEGYVSWEQFEENQQMLVENAHMQKRASRKSARGGRALLTGLVRCGGCGRMMRVFYGMMSGHAHRYQCRGDDSHVGVGLCIGIGGIRVDRAVAAAILDAVSDRGVEAAIRAADHAARAANDVRQAMCRALEDARYEVSLAARRYDLVDPAKRHVARTLEARWNAALERVAQLEQSIARLDHDAASAPKIDRATLMQLAHDLPAAWNAPTAAPRTKQRLTRILIKEVVITLDDANNEAVVTVHWHGGRHTELRVPRVRPGRYPADCKFSPVEVMRKLGGQWPDRELAVAMNRMRCKSADVQSWTTVRVRELRERLGIAAFDPKSVEVETISLAQAARRLKISIESVDLLIRQGILPATQLMPSAPWKIPVPALTSAAVRTGVQRIIARRLRKTAELQSEKNLRLPGF